VSDPIPSIAERVSRYLVRQIAWYETALDFLDALPALLAAGEHVHAAARQQEQQAALEQLTQEHDLLQREWAASRADGAPRDAHVASLSERSEALRQEVLRRQTAAGEILGAARAADLRGLNEVGQGKDLMDKYRNVRDDAAGFLDHQA
jgi:hypothetical protein